VPLNTREVLLIIRARDQATRLLADIGKSFGNVDSEAQAAAMSSIRTGSALAGVGVGLAVVGAAGLAFLKSTTEASAEYSRQSALTLTQIDQLGVSLDDVKQIGINVAKEIPAPFEQMQAALYDIFSSMDVNTTQAQTLLEGFAKAAVAGQTDVQTAGRATIAIMNAFKIPADQVNHVLDVQFEAVKKGVFTYDEFATSIGRAIPAALRAGQSFETVASMMAFMTRNGLSADMAATSAARALDLLSNPKFATAMHNFGIEVYDSTGNIRPMIDVMTELRDKLAGMSQEARTKALQDLTKGAGGTIQALRFLNLAVNDSQGLFGELTTQINNSSGSLGDAYNIMFAQPASQAQLLSNNVDILKTQIGDVLLPAVNKFLTNYAIPLLQWFNDMDPATRKLLVQIIFFGSVLLLVSGLVLIMVGAFLILDGVLALLGKGGLGVVAKQFGEAAIGAAALALAVWGLYYAFQALQNNDVVGAIIGLGAAFVGLAYALANIEALALPVVIVAEALAIPFEAAAAVVAALVLAVLALAYVIYRNWDTIKDKTTEVWDWVVDKVQTAWDKLTEFWGWLQNTVPAVWGSVTSFITNTWSVAFNIVTSTLESARDNIATIFGSIANVVEGWGSAVNRPVQYVWGQVNNFYNWLKQVFGPGTGTLLNAVGGFFSDVGNEIGQTVTSLWSRLQFFWTVFTYFFGPALSATLGEAQQLWDNFVQVFEVTIGFLILAAQEFASQLSDQWGFVEDSFSTLMTALGIVVGFFQMTFNDLLIIVTTVFGQIWAVISGFLEIIAAAWDQFNGVFTDTVQIVWAEVANFVGTGIKLVRDIIDFVLNLIQGDWAGAWDSILQFFIDIWNGIWTSLQNVWSFIRVFFLELGPSILGFIGDVAGTLWQKGVDLMSGLWNGLTAEFGNVIGWFQGLPTQLLGLVKGFETLLVDAGAALIRGIVAGIKSAPGAIKDAIGAAAHGAVDIIPGAKQALDALGLASGGIVTSPQIRLIGEAGPEVVIPLTNLARARSLALQSGLLDMLLPSTTASQGPIQLSGPLQSGSSGPRIYIQDGAFVFHLDGSSQAAVAADAVRGVLDDFITELQVR
jgi:TP901 family phage tail tape measure protein